MIIQATGASTLLPTAGALYLSIGGMLL